MLLTIQDINRVRPIAANINAKERLEPYLAEAERLRLMDVLGAPLYRWLDETDFTTGDTFTYTRPDGTETTITADDHDALMNGGYYAGCCGEKYSNGIVAATAYIAYSRFIVNNPINITAFGVRYKDGEFSSRTEDNAIVRASNDARRIGEAYFEEVTAHCSSLGLLECRPYTEAPRHIVRVGQRKL